MRTKTTDTMDILTKMSEKGKTCELTKELFHTEHVQNIINRGRSQISYGFFGISELQFVYDEMNMEEFKARMVSYLMYEFIDSFEIKKGMLEDNTIARKSISKWMGFKQKEAISQIVLEDGKKQLPNLSLHYLNRYITLRKKGVELSDYKVGEVVDNIRLAEENKLSKVTVYNMCKVFGYTPKDVITRERKTVPERRKVSVKKLQKTGDCPEKEVVQQIENAGLSLYLATKRLVKDTRFSEKEIEAAKFKFA